MQIFIDLGCASTDRQAESTIPAEAEVLHRRKTKASWKYCPIIGGSRSHACHERLTIEQGKKLCSPLPTDTTGNSFA